MLPSPIESSRTGHKESREQVLWTLYALGGEATLGDALAATGLPRADVEGALDELIAQGRVHARVLERGDLTFHLGGHDALRDGAVGHAPAELLRPGHRSALALARRTIFDRRTVRLIRAREGVLSLAELMEQTGLRLRDAEVEMRRLADAWGGQPHVGLDGHVVHAFPALMSSVRYASDAREPRPAWARADDPMDHGRERARRARLATGSVVAGMAVIATTPVLLATAIPAVGAVTIAAAGASLVGAGMWGVLRNHSRFRFRQRDALRRYALGCVVETALRGKGVVSLDRTVRTLQARANGRSVSRTAVAAALRELAEDFDAPVTTQGSDVFFGFRNVKRQFLASHLVRRQLMLGSTASGATVFDTADPPEVAAARELAAFDRELGAETQPS